MATQHNVLLYIMAKQQGGIVNLSAWMIDMVKKIRAGEASPPVKVSRRNRFNNFEGRGYDYAALGRLELEQLKAAITSTGVTESE